MSGIYIGCADGLPRVYDGENHLVTVGPPGTGKSTSLLMPNLAYLKRSILVIDPKGELAAVTARHRQKFGKVVILNPFGVLVDSCPYLKSNGFNPLAVLNPESDDFVDDATAIAEGIIRIDPHDPHWSEGARDFIAALIMHIRQRVGPTANLDLMRQLLTEPRKTMKQKGPQTDKKIIIKGGLSLTIDEMLNSTYEPIKQKVGRFDSSSGEIGSIISNAISQTGFLDSLPIKRDLATKKEFDFCEMRNGVVTVYLILPINRLSTHANWLRLMVACALRALTNKPDIGTNERVLFMLDEFAQLGYMSAISDAMSAARGFRIQLWPMLQDLTQLQQIYRDLWENFLGTAGFCSFFTPRTLVTADYLSRRFGVEERIKHSWSNDSSGRSQSSYQHVKDTIYQPQDFFGMPRHSIICFREFEAKSEFYDAPHYSNQKLAKWCANLDKNPYYVQRR